MLKQRYIEQLFRQNYSEMIHLARVLLGDNGEADDVVQDIFLRIAGRDIPPKSDNYLMVSEYNINLMWQLNRKYTFSAFAILEPDYFVQMAYQPSDRMAVVMKETNFDYSNYFGLQASAQFRIGSWLNGNVMATALYRHDKTNFFDLPIDRTCLSGILSGMAVVRLSQKHNIQFTLNPFFQTKAIQGLYDIDPFLRLNATLRYTSENGKWSLVAKGENILNAYINTHSTIVNQDYTMRVWMPYTNYSLTAIYRLGDFKEKKKKEVDTSRMGY